MRKLFKSVSILDSVTAEPLIYFRRLEQHIRLVATVKAAPEEKTAPNLDILVSPDSLEFVVHRGEKNTEAGRFLVDLNDIPEWKTYTEKSLAQIKGHSPSAIESFLQNAFAAAHGEDWQATALAMGERIGVRVGNALELTMAEHPHVTESKRIFAEIAHISLGYSSPVALLYKVGEALTESKKLVTGPDDLKPLGL